MYTFETLLQACQANNPRLLSNGARVDYGLDLNPNLFEVYREKIHNFSQEDLFRAAGNGPVLTEMFGVEIKTMWDTLEQ